MRSASASVREPIDAPQQERALTRQVKGGAKLEIQNPYINLNSEDSVKIGGVSLQDGANQPDHHTNSPTNLLPLALENSSQASISIKLQQNDIQHYIDEYERENNALQERITMLKQQIKVGNPATAKKEDNTIPIADQVKSKQNTNKEADEGAAQSYIPVPDENHIVSTHLRQNPLDSPSPGLSDDYQLGAAVKQSLFGSVLNNHKQKIHIK